MSRASPGLTDSGAEDADLELLVFGNVHRIKRSELIQRYDLEVDDGRIINIAQKQMAADQRLAEAKARRPAGERTKKE